MAVVTSDILAGALTNFRATFQAAFDAAQNMSSWRDIALQVQSQKLTESHNWLGTVPTMVDVTHSDLQAEGLFSFNYSITNNTYKAAIEVQRAVFEDDSLGLITPRIAQLAEEAARHPGQLVLQLLVNNGLAFDGTAFIADTRTIGRSANVDNNMASGGSGTTLAGFQADLATARATMRKFQDDQGRPLNNVGDTIMVPPELEQLAYQALNISFPAASPNVAMAIPGNAGTGDGSLTAAGYRVIVNPYLTDTNDWYLLCTRQATKPFIYQTRIAPSLEGPTTPNTESGTIRDRFLYTVRARYNAGYGDPRYCIRIVN